MSLRRPDDLEQRLDREAELAGCPNRCVAPRLAGIHRRRLAGLLDAVAATVSGLRLAELIAATAAPVIVADSGFRVPFDREVGRLR